jgi:hypothetical protein
VWRARVAGDNELEERNGRILTSNEWRSGIMS